MKCRALAEGVGCNQDWAIKEQENNRGLEQRAEDWEGSARSLSLPW